MTPAKTPTSRLRLTDPGELPAPTTDDLTLAVVTDAVETLARLRTPYWLGDTCVHLHALTSILAQANAMLPAAVADARDQGLTWTEIGQLLDLTADIAARRYRPHQ
jgi:hypothetical protein